MSKKKNQLKPIDAPIYGYWSALYQSFYSRRLYVDVGKRWKGLGIFYLLLAIALFSIPFAVKTFIDFNHSFKNEMIGPLLKIPVFYIQNGQVIFDKPMPYLINDDKNRTVVIIDTTGKVNNFSKEYPYLSILINKNQMTIKMPKTQFFTMDSGTAPSPGTLVVQPFDKEANAVFDSKKLAEDKAIVWLKYASQATIYPSVVAIFFSVFIVFFLVLALLGQTFSRIFFSFKIKFAVSSRLLIVSGTPMLLLLFIMFSFNHIFQGSGVILFFLLIAYYSYALFSLRAESKQVVAS